MTADPVPKTIQSRIESGSHERERQRKKEERQKKKEKEVSSRVENGNEINKENGVSAGQIQPHQEKKAGQEENRLRNESRYGYKTEEVNKSRDRRE